MSTAKYRNVIYYSSTDSKFSGSTKQISTCNVIKCVGDDKYNLHHNV